ncbi:carboxylesterase family protein [Crateriforma conspicua]|uniref:carboxylesterase family protein n=1 Tax=Crateriforma conspicua TaxID=2527996 RepID=UPI0011886955|nr:prolyl oligopeptidase family serine peptidase [Crateriforma conspicua]QDV61759.1 esterase [Crateriforma conspicua]
MHHIFDCNQPRLRRSILGSIVVTGMLAVLFAPAASAQDAGRRATEKSEQPQHAIGDQQQASLKTSDGGEIQYLLSIPDDFKGDKMPMMLFLHGRGESNGPLSLVAKWGPPMKAARGDAMPYLLVSPQCPREDQWRSPTQQQRLVELLDHIIQQHDVDTDRIYLTGLSMGGYGSWTLACGHPDRFAAVVPVCGGGEPEKASALVDVPVWAFHGDQDKAVPFEKSVDMVDAIRQAGGEKIRFTTMEHIGHNCWSATYATPELYDWISRHRLSDRQ